MYWRGRVLPLPCLRSATRLHRFVRWQCHCSECACMRDELHLTCLLCGVFLSQPTPTSSSTPPCTASPVARTGPCRSCTQPAQCWRCSSGRTSPRMRLLVCTSGRTARVSAAHTTALYPVGGNQRATCVVPRLHCYSAISGVY
jgi:hypothetical protein